MCYNVCMCWKEYYRHNKTTIVTEYEYETIVTEDEYHTIVTNMRL